MIDLYLRAVDRATMDATLIAAELIAEGDDPVLDVCLDRIGSYAIVTDYDGETPIVEDVNVPVLGNFDRWDAIANIMIPPPATPFRVWMAPCRT
ncbi:hypothetical protein GG804_27660 [Sphingomonas histidinilytica]|uniref:Uncharacterized protein n=1 Tax=Rhizorhabdus histidinilytica TaxID=439228 RepID=A0A1T5CRJ6_9SPHN|nr:hypothetical protein [Rhizorhabdus histidinilytica]MBO9380542.1 hypothetical protein [Rhizorhabdus histidinilytica]SKB62079.1 hypothetical protein SAMN06295920_104251 [Rhizorhabdus histidinilytica]